jgi:fibronectin-binding autotransporter adhesin
MKTYWETPTSNFFDTANWSGGTTPGANDIVALTVAGIYTVTSNTSHTVLGLVTGTGATLSISSLTTFTATEGTATGANAGVITILDGSTLRIGGIVDNTGLINLGGNTSLTKLAAMSNTTFEGGGRIQMTDDVHNNFSGLPTTSIITNVDNNISGAGTIAAEIFNNDKKGVINATGTNNRLVVNADVINSGLIEATGAAGLQFSGFGSIANKGGIIEAENGSTINLDGGNQIKGGTLKGNVDVGGNNGAMLDGSSAGTLSNQGAVAIENGASLSLRGVINNTGSIDLDGGATATSIILLGVGISAGTTTA